MRILACILRLLPKFSSNRTETASITDPYELDFAEQKLVYLVPSESLPSETKALLKSSPISKSSVVKDFSPFLGPNGLLRTQGRTKHFEVAYFHVKHPILLDSRHTAVEEKHSHQGVEYLGALIQQTFAIVKLRTALRTL